MASSTVKDHVPAAAPAQQGPAFSSSSSSAAQLAEDESRKKNTDCVYFLASPLTCKKGSECEYRHSEYARINPRDCWYWLNGNCLNPKCSFRHPPLDTLLGTPGENPAGSSVPVPSSTTVGSSLPPSRTASAAYPTAKPTVPCVFYQQGYCMKGDRCPFSHGQNPVTNKAPEFPAAAKVPESSRFNTAATGLQKSSQLKNPPHANLSKLTETAVPPQLKTSASAAKAVPRNGAFAAKSLMLHNVINENLHKHNETSSRSLNNGSSRNKPSIAHHASSRDQGSREAADDLVRESSPGFDVLVDDELGDGDYYGNDEQFPRIRGHEGRDLDEFEMGRPDHYKLSEDYVPVAFSDRHGYETYKPVHERRSRDSSEGAHYDPARNSDLRQRLSKQRRTNGLSSVVRNPDYPSENRREETRHRRSHRDSRPSPPPRGSSMISSRLQGRLKLPGQATPVNPPIMMTSEREYDRGRSHSRLSPNRPLAPSHRGRLQDRLRLKVQDDIIDYNSTNFSAPKSLAELKKGKQSHRSEEFTSVVKRKALESSRHSDADISFEPPKPLSEILKRKRKADDTNSLSTKNEETAVVEKKPPNEEDDSNQVEEGEFEAQNPDTDDKTKPSTETQISELNHVAEGEGLITDGVEDGHDQEEEEYYEEGDGGYEDEQEGREGYNLEGGENRELQEDEEEYMDEDDEDSFAKKIGVMFG